MSRVFRTKYAAAYDDFCREKNYEAECSIIERVFPDCESELGKDIWNVVCVARAL